MSTVASVDYPGKRIYLSAATVGAPLDTMEVYRDVRSLRVTTDAHRAFRPMIVGGGNIQKTATAYTQPYVQLLYGCRIVPFNVAQSLLVTRDTFTDDGESGVGCFDRSTLTAEVDIDIQVAPVEVREVVTGGGGSSGGITTGQYNALLIAINSRSSLTLTEVKSAASTGSAVVTQVLTADVSTNMPLTGA